MSERYAYIRDGAEIYRRSCAIIRAEADLTRFSPEEEKVAVRLIHACGLVEAAADFAFSPGAVVTARAAIAAGAPILCDSKMEANGVTRARLLRAPTMSSASCSTMPACPTSPRGSAP